MKAIFDQIVYIVEDYLGPVAGRFVHRQITSRLNKRTDEIIASDIPSVTEQIVASLNLLTENEDLIDGCKSRLLALKTMEQNSE